MPAAIIPAKYGINMLVNSPVLARSLTPKTMVAKLTGKYKINVYFKATSLFNPQSKHKRIQNNKY